MPIWTDDSGESFWSACTGGPTLANPFRIWNRLKISLIFNQKKKNLCRKHCYQVFSSTQSDATLQRFEMENCLKSCALSSVYKTINRGPCSMAEYKKYESRQRKISNILSKFIFKLSIIKVWNKSKLNQSFTLLIFWSSFLNEFSFEQSLSKVTTWT